MCMNIGHTNGLVIIVLIAMSGKHSGLLSQCPYALCIGVAMMALSR